MSSVITERIAAYDLLDEERSALSAILHRIEAERQKVKKTNVDVEATVKDALLNSVICRALGLDNLQEKFDNVMKYLAIYRKAYRC